MTRAIDDGQIAALDLGTLPVAGLLGGTEERVVLSPPSVTIMVAEQDDTGTIAAVANPEDPRANNGVLVPTGIRPVQRRIPMWPVATALIVGAFVTLSAQAVMRRSPRANLTTVTATAATTAIATTTENHGRSAESVSTPSSTSTLAALAETGPLVAPSTVTVWNTKARISPEPRRTNRVQRPINSAERTPHARAARLATNNRAATTWVDPFASMKVAPKTASKPRARPPVQTTAWVDPFAN